MYMIERPELNREYVSVLVTYKYENYNVIRYFAERGVVLAADAEKKAEAM